MHDLPESGPDPSQIIERLKVFYSTHPYIFHKLEYKLYPDHTSLVPYATENGIFIKKDGVQYSQLSSIESLTTSEYNIGIDNDEKMMMISNIVQIPGTSPIEKFESMISPDADIKVNTLAPQLGELQYQSEEGEIEELRLVYNMDTYQIVKLTFKYRRGIQLSTDAESDFVTTRLEVEYTTSTTETHYSEKLKMDTYAVFYDGQWTLTPAYHNYELIKNIQSYTQTDN